MSRKYGRICRRKPRRHTVHREVWGIHKTEAKERIVAREMLALRNKVKEEEHFRYIRGFKRRNRNENVFARPNGLRETSHIAISDSAPGPVRKKRSRRKMHGCALVAKH